MPPQLESNVLDFIAQTLGHTEFQVMPLAGDASNRRYYRIILGERSLVLMSWEPFKDDGTYPFLSVLRHFQRNHVHVPNVVAMSPDLGQVLLEDLGDLTLERKFWENQDQDEVIPFYKQAIDELIKIHFRATQDRTDCTAFHIDFNTERLLWEMNYGKEHLLEKMCGLQFSEKLKKQIGDCFLKICNELSAEPKHICHRDYHSRNLMLKLGKMRVIDFQDARLGPIQYDLVSLFKDSYVAIDDTMAQKLLSYYQDQAAAVGATLNSKQHFEHIYERQSIQRCFKACGSFASFYNLREDSRYLKYLHGTLARVRVALSHFQDMKPFLDLLTDNGLFERGFDLGSNA